MKILDDRIEFTGLLRELPWGNVHLARDKELARSVVVVEVNRHSFAADSEVRQYVRTAFGLTQISHNNVQQVIGVKRAENGTPFIILEQVGGTRLATLLAQRVELNISIDAFYFILAQIAKGLAATHDAKDRQTAEPLMLNHLSLNPQNIWLAESGAVRLTEFQYPAMQIKEVDHVAYLAPEQIQGSRIDRRADLFSLGVIAYEMFTGVRLFAANSVSEVMAAILKGDYDLQLLHESRADQSLCNIIEGCIQLNSANRKEEAAKLADRADALVRQAEIRPEKRIRETVDKVIENPKLGAYPAGRSERVRTRSINRTDFDEGTHGMTDQSRNDRDDERRPRAGQETRISTTPVSERLKRAKRSGLGGNKTIFFLGIVAALLVLVVGALVVRKLMQDAGTDDVPSVTEMQTGTMTSIPDGVAVYSADSLIGYTPLSLTMAEGELLTLKHPCCPDSSIVLNFERLSEGPFEMTTNVLITSSPVGARLILNGQDIGLTTPYPFVASTRDTIQFTLQMEGKAPLTSGPVVLADFASLNISSIDVTRIEGGGIQFEGSFVERLLTSITTYPRDARVVITSSGVEVGTTPIKKDFGDDPVMLTITREGYEDRILELPSAKERKSTYKEYLFRRVDVQAYEAGHPDRTVNARIVELVYDGKSYSQNVVTPASVRLPGIDCRLILLAEGYLETDTIITPMAREFTVVMRKREGGQVQVPGPDDSKQDGAKAEVRIFVIDDKKSPVANALVTAEYKKDKEKLILDLGRSNDDGRVVALLTPNKYKFFASHVEFKTNDESKEVKAGEQYVLTIKVKRR